MDEIQQPVVSDDNDTSTKKRNRIIFYILIVLCVIGLGCYLIWKMFFEGYESTDDAYVGANIVVISPRQEGTVIAYYVNDTDYVKAGELLVQLDPTDSLGFFEQKKAVLAIAAREVLGLYQDVQQKKANVLLQEAKQADASKNVQQRQSLVTSNAIAAGDFQRFSTELKVTDASLSLARYQLEAAEASLGKGPLNEHPLILKAKIEAGEAYFALLRCNIFAPVSGLVAKRNVQLGQFVKSGSPLMSIVPLNYLWVDANFKETQLQHLRIGQAAQVTSDLYGSKVVFHGRVEGMQPGSGSVFSLLPSQNASGNWIKIVQRVPVRISLDPEEIKQHPLVTGLSVFVSVDLKDTKGSFLSNEPDRHEVKTSIFDISLVHLETILDAIVNENLGEMKGK